MSGENDPKVQTVLQWVCCRISLPSGFMLNNSCHCLFQSTFGFGVARDELNMMREPSADQCGCESSPPVCVNWLICEPSASITKISEWLWGSPANAIVFMSGGDAGQRAGNGRSVNCTMFSVRRVGAVGPVGCPPSFSR